MVKKIVILMFIIPLFVLYAKSGYEHDADICGLFYDKAYADHIINSSRSINAICSASFLSLDYNSNKNYKEKGRQAIKSLENVGVSFSFSLENLYLLGDGGSDHEKFTHKGWEPYQNYDDTTYDRWLLRKEILISTVVKIFEFSNFDENLCLKKLQVEKAYNQERLYLIQGDFFSNSMSFFDKVTMFCSSKSYSFSAIIYYTHILGDIENNSINTASTRMTLKDLCIDLEKHLKIVFGSKLNTMLGKTLVDSLKASNDPNRILINLQSTMQELLPEESFYSNSYVAKEISGLN